MSRKKKPDPAYPERYPDAFLPIRCACCRSCWYVVEIGKCLCGGPFSGYLLPDGRLVDINEPM